MSLFGTALIEDEKVFYSVPNTSVKYGLRNKEELANGTLLMIERADGCHIEWQPLVDISADGGAEEGWSVVNADAVGYTNNKSIELTEVGEVHADAIGDSGADSGALFSQSKLRHIEPIHFHMAELKSVKRVKRSFKNYNSSIIFILTCGTTLPPIYFQNGGTNDFITQLTKKAIVRQSSRDTGLYIISMHQSEALGNSFDALNLFEDQTSALERFTSNPLRNTLTAFAKVTNALSDALVAPREGSFAVRPEFCDQLRTSLEEGELDIPTVNDSRVEDSEFLFVDQRVQLPEVEPQQRMSPVDVKRWEECYMVDGKLLDPEHVKYQIFRGGVTPQLRPTVWKYLLSYYPWSSTLEEREVIHTTKHDEYFTMKAQWKTMSESQMSRFTQFRDHQSLIEKDVNRTDRCNPFFSGDGNERLTQLNDILMTYTMYNFDLGYVQGMSDLLSPLLLVMQDEVDTFWCFVGFMNLVETNFEMDQEGMKMQLNQLNQLLQVVDRKLYNYLDSQDSSNMYFAFRWLLILFKREFSMDEIMCLWEILWTGMPCKNYQLVMAVSLLTKSRNVIMESGFSFNEILKHINDLSGQIDLNDLLVTSEALAQQLLECKNLPTYVSQIIGRNSDNSSAGPSPYETLRSSPLPRLKKTAPPRPATTPTRNPDP